MNSYPHSLSPASPSTKQQSYTAGPDPQRSHGAFRLSRLTSHLSLLTAVALTTAAMAGDSIPPKLPLQDFFRNPQTAGYTLSDDGKYLAFLAPWQDRLNVWVQSVTGGEAKRLTDVTDRDLAGVSWKGNDTVLFEKDNGGDENYHLFAVAPTGGEPRDLTPFPGVRVSIIDDLQDDPTHLLIQTNQRD